MGLYESLSERRNNVWEQAKAIADVSVEEGRDFTAEEESAWQKANAEINALDERMKSVLEGEERAAKAAEAFERLAKGPKSPEAQRKFGNGDVDEFRSFLAGRSGRAFEVAAERLDFRALAKGTASAGGNTVPTSFYGRLMAHLIETSAILQSGATVLNTGSGEVIQIPKTTAHSTASLVTEAQAITESDPAFGQASLGAYKYGALITVSRELLEDSGVDLEGYLAMQAGRALGNAFGAHAVTGTGTNQPSGLVTGASLGKTGGTTVAGAFTADDIIDLYYSVISPYRSSSAASWLVKDTTLGALRKLKDTTGQYLWQPALTAGAPDLLLGKPVLTDPNVAGVGLGAKSVVFGDMSQYFVRLAGGIRFERSDEAAFATDQVTFRAIMRADGVLVDQTGAVRYFAVGAS